MSPSRHFPYLVIALAVAITACDHPAPFSPGAYAPTGPLGAGNPVLLTYGDSNSESDRAVWLADGSGFYYTRSRADRPDRDRCLALMPRDGGAVIRQICDDAPAAADSLNTYESPAIAPDGGLAMYETSTLLGVPREFPDFRALALTRLDQPSSIRVLQIIPYFSPASNPINAISNLHWESPSTLLYLGERIVIEACQGCVTDFVRTGQEIDRIDLGGTTPVVSALPGTDQASSFTLVGGDSLYFTLNGDPNVYRRILPAGADSVIHAFGGIARDVSVAGGRLAAVVGGAVSYAYDSNQSAFVQVDHGGAVHLLTLVTGADTVVSDTLLMRRPALDVSGTRLVAEAHAGTNGVRTALWLWKLP